MAEKTELAVAQIEVRSIEDLHLDPANIRQRDEETEQMLAASLTAFKPFRSIAVDADLVTRAGNGTLKAARVAGVKEVLLVRPEPGQLVAVQRSDLTPTQLTAYSIADNRLTDRSTNDEIALVEILRSLESEDFDLKTLGYDEGEVDWLIDEMASELAGDVIDDPKKEWQGMPEFEHEDLMPVQTVHVHFKSREDVEEFAKLIDQRITEKTKFVWFPKQEIIGHGTTE